MTPEQLPPHNQTPQEASPKREILIPIPDVITISGYSGVGKTTVAHILKRLLDMRFEKVGGEKFREWYEKTTGQKVLGFADRDPAVDKALDDYTTSRVTQAIKTGRKIIVEARLGGWLAKKVEEEQKQKISLTKTPSERIVTPVLPRESCHSLLSISPSGSTAANQESVSSSQLPYRLSPFLISTIRQNKPLHFQNCNHHEAFLQHVLLDRCLEDNSLDIPRNILFYCRLSRQKQELRHQQFPIFRRAREK